jgi:hypothetical protein
MFLYNEVFFEGLVKEICYFFHEIFAEYCFLNSLFKDQTANASYQTFNYEADFYITNGQFRDRGAIRFLA